MAKTSKILNRLVSGSKNVRFADFVNVMEAFGFTLERVTGSHHILSHSELPQTIVAQPDKNGQAKAYQIRQFLKLVEKYQLSLDE